MVYLDTSCLLKLLRDERQSEQVRAAVLEEMTVVISSLAELEAEIQFSAEVTGGRMRRSQWRHLQAKLAAMRNFEPFLFKHLPGSVFATALQQVCRADSVHCRPLDRLHLAAMEELKLNRLMTLDKAQAKIAETMGYSVVEI